MKDTLLMLLQAVIIAAVPVITTFVCNFLKKKADAAAVKLEGEQAEKYIRDAADAVSTAVAYTSQTYVDGLKKSGSFTVENQKEAFNTAMRVALEILGDEGKEFILQAYGDIVDYLTAKIEAEVKAQKNEGGIIVVTE